MSPRTRPAAAAAAILALVLAAAVNGRADTLPEPVFSAVHGRIVGWAESPPSWFAVYLEGKGTGWCGLQGASWWIALVGPANIPNRVIARDRIGRSMCGNSLAWARAGRFSDGRHREVAFMLWQTPSLGATTYLYRIDGTRLVRLASFYGDRVVLRRGTVTVGFENRGRNPRGDLTDVYRFESGRYRLVHRR